MSRSELSFVALLYALSVFGGACGASQAAAPAPQTAQAARELKVAPVPSDPRALISADASSVVDVQLTRLHAAGVFARNRGLLVRTLCIPSSELDWLFSAATRALVAGRTPAAGSGNELLVVLSGNFDEPDADRLLRALSRTPAAPPPEAPGREQLARFSLLSRAGFAASVLDAHSLVVGHAGWVRQSVASIEHPAPTFAASAQAVELTGLADCSVRTLCVLTTDDVNTGKRLQHTLSSVGARALGRDLSTAYSALGITLGDDAALTYRGRFPSADAAAAAAGHAKDWLWQAALVLRLAGLPDVLDHAHIQPVDALLQADLQVSTSELSELESRLRAFIDDDSGRCGEVAPSTAP